MPKPGAQRRAGHYRLVLRYSALHTGPNVKIKTRCIKNDRTIAPFSD
jgi:hypothetical protein